VNRLLNAPDRQTQDGEPCVKEAEVVSNESADIILQFCDGLRFELKDYRQRLQLIEADIKIYNSSFDSKNHYVAVLLVINYASSRVQEREIELGVKVLKEWGLPLAFVFS
jgi:hypothetical protein